MKIEQIYTSCLAEASYFIHSNGEAVIIDPIRETQPYLDKLAEANVKLKYIFETHFHADFVSGHVDLAAKTGATIVYGPDANPDFEVLELADGDKLKVGALEFTLLHTPGHTLECSCYLMHDADGKPHSIFTGDTLFIGDVGRPDLAIDNGLSKEDLARMMYHSLREKIMPLDDNIIVYPAHGAGSACGKNMSSETFDTLGNQKKTNYALRADMSEQEFIDEVLDGMPPAPEYFELNALLNKNGYDSIDMVMKQGMTALSAEKFKEISGSTDVVIIDTRHQQVFKDGFIPGSLFFGIDGSFAPWVANVLKEVKTTILFIADHGREEEVVTRLSRVGFDNVIGYLEGGIESWTAAGYALDKIESVSVDVVKARMEQDQLNVMDVRKPTEYEAGRMDSAENYPLDYIEENIDKLDKSKKYYIHCRSGYRSMVYASIMLNEGFKNPVDIAGGFNAIKESGHFTLVERASCSLS